jgi:ATP-dependent RNA helicase DeaD
MPRKNAPSHGKAPQNAPTLFSDLSLDPRILRAIQDLGFDKPTPIQAAAIPELLDGADMIGGARTGSGKTAAFGIPLIERVKDGGRHVRALVLAPTRELAKQVAGALDDLARHLPIKILTIYGGVGYKDQLRGLRSGSSVVVGTPGRVKDLLSRGALDLSKLDVFVLDEADEMLQMGFIEDIEEVLQASPDGRQIALFSATMPPPIERIAQRYLTDPAQIQVEGDALTASHVTQAWIKTSHRRKSEALERILMASKRDAVLVFARTRARVADLGKELATNGFSVDSLHGDLSQSAREAVLAKLRAKQVDVVVATDVAARGLDVDHISHVINYDLPENSETHVHRIGRTARAGREGLAITFVTQREMGKFNRIQKDLGERIDRMSVPGDADILAYQRQSLIDELDEAMDASGSEHAEAWLEEILESSGWSAPDVAAAALSLLAMERNFSLRKSNNAKSRDDRDGGSSDGHAKTEEDFAHLNQVELFFAAGRRDGLRPADFVGALCNEAGLPSSSIGRITMGGHKAFVGLPRRVAEHLLRERATLEVRGHTHPLRLSLQSQEQSAGIDAPSNSDNRGHRSSRREDGDTFRRQPSKRRSSKKHHKKGKKNKNKGKRKHHRNNDKK